MGRCGPHIQRAACGIKGRTPGAKGRKENGKRAPPHHCSGAVLPDSYFLHDPWGQILNVFLQTIDGCSLCSAVISPHRELAWSSTCVHLHRKSMELLRKGEMCSAKMKCWCFLRFSFSPTWLELQWESDFLSHCDMSAIVS